MTKSTAFVKIPNNRDIKKVGDISKILAVNIVTTEGLGVPTRADIIPCLEKFDLSQLLSHTSKFSVNIRFKRSHSSLKLS